MSKNIRSIFIKYSSISSISLGILVVIGWVFQINFLISISMAFNPMKFNTAIALICAGISLLFALSEHRSSRLILLGTSSILFLLGFFNVIQYLFEINLGIDEYFIKDHYAVSHALKHPGRMSPVTATCITLLATSMLLLKSSKNFLRNLSQWLLHTTTIISLVTIIGYLYSVPAFYKVAYYSPMAIHTSSAIFLLSIAAAFVNPTLGFTGLFLGKSMGNTMARKLFLPTIIVLLILGILRIESHRLGIVSVEFGIAMFVTIILLGGLVLIAITAHQLNRIDVKRSEAEEALKALNHTLEYKIKERTAQLSEVKERFELATQGAEIGIWEVDLSLLTLKGNEYFYKFLGIDKATPNDNTQLFDNIHPQDRDLVISEIYKATPNNSIANFEYRVTFQDGTMHHIKVIKYLHQNSLGTLKRIYGACIDITAQKIADEKFHENYKHVKIFIDNAPTAIAMVDTQMRYIAASKHWISDYNLTYDNIIGQSYYEVFGETVNERKKIHEQCLLGESMSSDGERFLRADGSEIWLKWSVVPWYIFENEIGGLIIHTVDITQKKIAERELNEAKERLQLATTASRIGIWDSNIAENTLVWDENMYYIYGYTPDMNMTPDEILEQALSPEQTKASHMEIYGYLQNPEISNFSTEFKVTWPDKSIHHILGAGTIQRNSEGNPVRLIGTALDITLQKEQLESLRRSEERYHKMISEIKDYAILLIDTNGDIQNWNHGAEHIKGYKTEEIVGKNFRTFYTQEDIATRKPDRLLAKSLKDGWAQDEGWRVRKDGTTFWASVTITALHDAHSNIIGFSKITRDLTDRRKAELLEKMEAKNKELEQFAYVASHDLQEPLRTITSFVELLNNQYGGQLDDTADKYLRFVMEASQRMRNLIKELLDYSRLGKTQELVTTDCNEIVKQIQDDLNVRIKDCNALISIENLPTIEAYKTEFRVLLQNLISNALKFRKPNTVPEISIKVEKESQKWKFSVQDNGIGIDPKYDKKIFLIFQRLHTHNQYEGTGIGLAHCRKIVEMHGGEIWVESELGKGCTFYFTISCHI